MFREKIPIIKRIKEAFRPTPLRQRITSVLLRLRLQLRRLERSSMHLEQRQKTLHEKCVAAIQTHNDSLAAVYANECVEVRRIIKIVLNSQLVLEQVTMRLETVRNFGDIAYTMHPLVKVIDTVKGQLEAVMPEVSMELANIGEALESMTLEIGEVAETAVDTAPATEEAGKILSQAGMLAEQRMKEKFPELPTIAAGEAH